MTFLQLNYIMEILKFGSINKAAQNLFVSQSSISNSIRELEEELGIHIFKRSNRGILLTDDGHDFLNYIRPIVEQQKKIKHIYSHKNLHPTIRVHISTQHYPFCAKAFVRLLESQESDKYEFHFKETGMYQTIEDVFQHNSDIGIIFLSDSTEKFMNKVLTAREMEFHLLKKVRPHIFFGEQHPLSHRKTLSVEELKNYPYVVFVQNGNESYNFSEEAIPLQNKTFSKIIYVNDRATIYNLMAYTNAFSTGSGLLPAGYADTRIKAVPIAEPIDTMRLGWIKTKGMEPDAIIKKYIAFLTEALEEEADSDRNIHGNSC